MQTMTHYDKALALVREAAAEAAARYDANWHKCKPYQAFDAQSLGEMYGAKKALENLLRRMEEARAE